MAFKKLTYHPIGMHIAKAVAASKVGGAVLAVKFAYSVTRAH